MIKEESISELLRFTIRQILNQAGNDQIYHYLERQQQIHSEVILPSTTPTPVSHQHQVLSISRTNNLVGQKMTPWKLLSLLSMEKMHHTLL